MTHIELHMLGEPCLVHVDAIRYCTARFKEGVSVIFDADIKSWKFDESYEDVKRLIENTWNRPLYFNATKNQGGLL